MQVNLKEQYDIIKQEAETRGLAVISLPKPFKTNVEWSDDLISFLDLAVKASVAIVYIQTTTLNIEDVMDVAISSFDRPRNVETLAIGDDRDTIETQAREAIKPWLIQEGELIDVSCTWIVQGISHTFRIEAEWYG